MALSEVSTFFLPVKRVFSSFCLLLLRVKGRGCQTLLKPMRQIVICEYGNFSILKYCIYDSKREAIRERTENGQKLFNNTMNVLIRVLQLCMSFHLNPQFHTIMVMALIKISHYFCLSYRTQTSDTKKIL